MTAPAKPFNNLSVIEQKKLKKTFQTAVRAVLGYNGQSQSWTRAISALAEVEAVRTQHAPEAKSHAEKMAAEAELSKLARQGRAYSTDDLLDTMDRVAGRLFRRTSQGLAPDAIHTVKLNTPLIRPAAAQGGIVPGEGAHAYVPAAHDPRTERLLGLLYRNGIHMDEMVRYEGPPTTGTVRQHPYNVIAIPNRDIEIAVCDEVDQTTMLARPALGALAYTVFDKAKLKQQPEVRQVDHTSQETWEREITAFINGSPAGRKVEPSVFAAKPPRLSVAILNEIQLQHILDTGKILTKVSGANEKKILANGETDSSLNDAIRLRKRGLAGQLPDDVKSLTDVARWQQEQGVFTAVLAQRGVSAYGAGIKRNLKVNDLVELHRAQILKTGRVLTQRTAVEDVAGQMEEGETPIGIDQAIRKRGRGLPDMPAQVVSLATLAQWQHDQGAFNDVLEAKGLRFEDTLPNMGPRPTPKQPLTVALITDLHRQQIAKEGRILSAAVKVADIAGKVDAGETAPAIETAIRARGRGLSDLPAHVTNLPSFAKWQHAQGAFDAVLQEKGISFESTLPVMGQPKRAVPRPS